MSVPATGVPLIRRNAYLSARASDCFPRGTVNDLCLLAGNGGSGPQSPERRSNGGIVAKKMLAYMAEGGIDLIVDGQYVGFVTEADVEEPGRFSDSEKTWLLAQFLHTQPRESPFCPLQ